MEEISRTGVDHENHCITGRHLNDAKSQQGSARVLEGFGVRRASSRESDEKYCVFFPRRWGFVDYSN